MEFFTYATSVGRSVGRCSVRFLLVFCDNLFSNLRSSAVALPQKPQRNFRT